MALKEDRQKLDFQGLQHFFNKLKSFRNYKGTFEGIVNATELNVPELSPEALIENRQGLFLLGTTIYYKSKEGELYVLNKSDNSITFFNFFTKDADARVEDKQSLQIVINQWNGDNIGEDWINGGMGETFYKSHKDKTPVIKFLTTNKTEIIGYPIGYNNSNGVYNYSWQLLLPSGEGVILNLINGVFSIK